tara:strand:- start:2649 stop:3410 length:762 start_codon:yes stop_codon:yes gene_type:complete
MFDFKNERYNRQINMPEWGEERQSKLKNARVAVIGAGGVKSTLLMALAASGIGNIRIIEFDKVELSNLNRQTLYNTSDIGKLKVERSASLLKLMNNEINIEPVNKKITSDNIYKLLDGFDFIVEGGESPAGRNLVNEYCLDTKKPYVHASAQFNYGYAFSVLPEKKSACFACFFPNEHTREVHTGAVPVNVLAVQIAGTLGATEVLKYFLGYKDKLIINKRIAFSSLFLSQEFEYIKQKRLKDCPVCSKYYDE